MIKIKYKITSRYLSKEEFRDSAHNGIDFAMPNGTPLRSVERGIVEKTVDYGDSNIGKGVFIKFENGDTAIYGHMSKIDVVKGDILNKGDIIGRSGNSGNVVGENGGYHLHFATKDIDGHFTDPKGYIDLIQNMNTFTSSDTCIPYTIFDYADNQMDVYSDLFNNLKINSINYPVLIENIQNLFKFIS